MSIYFPPSSFKKSWLLWSIYNLLPSASTNLLITLSHSLKKLAPSSLQSPLHSCYSHSSAITWMAHLTHCLLNHKCQSLKSVLHLPWPPLPWPSMSHRQSHQFLFFRFIHSAIPNSKVFNPNCISILLPILLLFLYLLYEHQRAYSSAEWLL